MNRKHENRVAFLDMLRNKRPEIYSRVMSRVGQIRQPGLSGLGADTTAVVTEESWWDTIVKGVKDLAPTYAQFQLSKDLYSLNMQRAKQGLPPIDASNLAPQMQVGLTSETRMMVFGLGAVALIAVMALARRRR